MKYRVFRIARVIATGAILMQVAGCDPTRFIEFTQTVFLGITAAGSIAIIQNL